LEHANGEVNQNLVALEDGQKLGIGLLNIQLFISRYG
jgi:hypothetical protein